MHNFAKPLEVACVDMWGRQGIGHKTPFQMIYLFTLILKQVKKEMSRSRLNEIWAKVTHKLRSDPKWQAMAKDNCAQSFEAYLQKLEGLEEEDVEAAVKLSTEAPVNVQDPVILRWGSILDTIPRRVVCTMMK